MSFFTKIYQMLAERVSVKSFDLDNETKIKEGTVQDHIETLYNSFENYKEGLVKNPISILSNADLNDYKKAGVYKCTYTDTAGTIKNRPTPGNSFVLEVLDNSDPTGTGSIIIQRLTYITRETWVRSFYSNQWQPWIKNNNLDASDIKFTSTDTNLSTSANVNSAIENHEERLDILESFSAVQSLSIIKYVGPCCPSEMKQPDGTALVSKYGSYFGDGTANSPYASFSAAITEFGKYRLTGSASFTAALYPFTKHWYYKEIDCFIAWSKHSKPSTLPTGLTQIELDEIYKSTPPTLFTKETNIKPSNTTQEGTWFSNQVTYFDNYPVGFVGTITDSNGNVLTSQTVPSVEIDDKFFKESDRAEYGDSIQRTDNYYILKNENDTVFATLYVYKTDKAGNNVAIDTGIKYKATAALRTGAGWHGKPVLCATCGFTHIDCIGEKYIHVAGIYHNGSKFILGLESGKITQPIQTTFIFHEHICSPNGRAIISVRCGVLFSSIRFYYKPRFDSYTCRMPTGGGPYCYGNNGQAGFKNCEFINNIASLSISGYDPNAFTFLSGVTFDMSEFNREYNGEITRNLSNGEIENYTKHYIPKFSEGNVKWVENTKTEYTPVIDDTIVKGNVTYTFDGTKWMCKDIKYTPVKDDTIIKGDVTYILDDTMWYILHTPDNGDTIVKGDVTYNLDDTIWYTLHTPVNGDTIVKGTTTYTFDGTKWMYGDTEYTPVSNDTIVRSEGTYTFDGTKWINFYTPVNGDTIVKGTTTYTFDGTKWIDVNTGYTPVNGDTIVNGTTTYILDDDEWYILYTPAIWDTIIKGNVTYILDDDEWYILYTPVNGDQIVCSTYGLIKTFDGTNWKITHSLDEDGNEAELSNKIIPDIRPYRNTAVTLKNNFYIKNVVFNGYSVAILAYGKSALSTTGIVYTPAYATNINWCVRSNLYFINCEKCITATLGGVVSGTFPRTTSNYRHYLRTEDTSFVNGKQYFKFSTKTASNVSWFDPYKKAKVVPIGITPVTEKLYEVATLPDLKIGVDTTGKYTCLIKLNKYGEVLLPEDSNYNLALAPYWTEYDLLEFDSSNAKYCPVGMFVIADNPINGSEPIVRTPTERLIANDLSIIN